ncbi:MAG: RNA methyltransferase [Eubacteriaceae bacterium]|nr:RNA methyltransferase [Eubacteriaceae bacterium]
MNNDIITSKANLTVKMIKSLGERKYREENGLFIVEGERFVNELSAMRITPEYIIASPAYGDKALPIAKRTLRVSDEVFRHLSDVVTPGGIMAVCAIPSHEEQSLFSMKRIVYLDALQLPDNVGAIIRSAACAGYDAVVLGKGCADCYSPKAVRASASNIFHIGVFFDRGGLMEGLKDSGFCIIGAHLKGEITTPLNAQKLVLVIGNEGKGMSDALTGMCDSLVKIPIKQGCESLNAAAAAAVLIYKSIGY